MEVLRTQSVFINSSNRSDGTISNAYYNFQNDQIKANDDEVSIKVTVLHFCANRSYYTVEDKITFSLSSTSSVLDTTIYDYTIKSSYYDVYTFKDYLISILPGIWTIDWDESVNKYTFHPPVDTNTYSFIFQNSGHLFGFESSFTTDEFTNTLPLTSIRPILMYIENSIFIHCDAPRKFHGAIHNIDPGSTEFRECNMLAAIPLYPSSGPFYNMAIDLSNRYEYYLSVKQLTRINIRITDQNNNVLPLKHDYTIGLKFEFLVDRSNESIDFLKEIRDLLKIAHMDKILK